MSQGPFVVNVFWEGTANTLDPPTTQISLFAVACVGLDVGAQSEALEHSDGPFKLAFAGCGVSHGLKGALFANGLREEAGLVASHVTTLSKRGRHVVLNVYGLSRGGIAAIFLAQALQDRAASALSLNMLLFDPVPGDFVWSGFPWTGKNAKDVSLCYPLRRVLALYPHEPLEWFAFHAPVLCKYPPDCSVEEDVVLGCHQGALFGTGCSRDTITISSNLSFRRILDFGASVGTLWESAGRLAQIFDDNALPTVEDCLCICRDALKQGNAVSYRAVHDGAGAGRSIVRRRSGEYLNRYHEELEQQVAGRAGATPAAAADVPKYMLDFEVSRCCSGGAAEPRA